MFKFLKNLKLRFEGGSSSYKHGIQSCYGINISPNAEVGFTRSSLVSRCRHLAENNEFATHALTLYCDYVLGSFITFDFSKLNGREGNIKKFKDLFDAERTKTTFDFYGKFNFDEFLWNAVYTMLKDGDVFIRKRNDAKSPFNCSFQLIEIDQLARDRYSGGVAQDGSYIDKGIRYDEQGRIISYFFYKSHPSGENFTKSQEVIEIKAWEIHHLSCSFKNRPAQTLGIPLLSPVIVRLDQLSQYDRSQVKKQIVSGLFAMILKKTGLDGIFGDAPRKAGGSGSEYSVMPQKTKIDTMTDGTILELGQGFEASFPTQPRTDEYEKYNLVNGRMIAVGTHIPEPILTNNFAGVNFSSLRGATLPFIKRLKSMRGGAVSRAVSYMIDWIIVSGSVTYDLGLSGSPKQSYEANLMFDPVKEAQALKQMMRLGIYSYKDVIAEYGSSTYEDVLAEREAYRKEKSKRGLLDDGDPADDLGRIKENATK